MDKLDAAHRRAIEINPENERERRTIARTPTGRRGGERRIAVVVGRKWPAKGVRLSVSFLDTPPADLRTRIIRHMNAWGEHANVLFSETKDTGEVRIARLKEPPEVSGFWSWVGTEILEAELDEPTMNLEGFTMKTSDSEFRRVVRHEAGHTLGFDHEHMRSEIVKMIDRKKAFAFFDKTQGWTKEEIEEQVLTPLVQKSIMGTQEVDPVSIMCYQLPGSIMKNGKAIKGGVDINPRDFAFAASLYPKPGAAPDRQIGKRVDSLVPPTETTPEQLKVKPETTISTPSTMFAPRTREASETFELVVMDEFKSGADPRRAGSTPKFAQVFASYGGARVTSVMQLRADKGEEKTRFGEIIRMHERIKAYTNREEGSLPGDDEMISFGGKLFDTLFQGDVRRLYDEARTRQHGRLDLVLTSMIPWIAEKPWEFSYDHGRQSFLATEEIHFIRNVLTNVPADPIARADGPLRILVVSAQPVGFGRLSIEQEVQVIQRGFEPLVEAGLVQIDTLARATPSMIHGRLTTGNYQVVHFIGHGVYNEERGEGCLIFVNEQGSEYPLGERSVREIFRGRGLSLVFLNACESGRGGRADFNKGVAQSLVAHGLPALVANQYSVLDSSATSFAQQFYWSLAQGMSLGVAAREARIAVNYLLHGEPIDWAVPVLYARDADATLCTPPTTGTRVPSTNIRASARRSTIAHGARIGVWDMDSVFPSLDKTLETMTRAQTSFGFELVDLSVPLGVWDLDSKKGTPYLWAELLASRLERMPMELGVELLVCVTRHWLRNNEVLNLYGWWPSDRRPPIIIFSIAGFEELAPEGAETDRAISNAMVTGLAGYYGEFASHRGSSGDCPMWYNEKRNFEHLVSHQRFDASCKKKLRLKVGQKFSALEALLKAFA
jgi:hypothetical protein